MAANAHVITMGLNSALNADIAAWFKQFNFLPPLGLTQARLDAVTSNVSFVHLLELVAASPHDNFILIIHGHEDGSGLWLKLTQAQANPHTTHHDLQRLMDLDAGGTAMSAKDYSIIGIARSDVAKILS